MDEHLLGETQAAYALDARFEHGSIDAWREPRLIHTAPEGTLTSFQHGCCWLDFSSCVDYAAGAVTCPDQVFITGRTTYPERLVVDQATCGVSYHRLGLPCPDTAPSVMYGAGSGAEKDNTGYSYAYQYENVFAEYSSLSPASPSIMWPDGSTNVVSGWGVPDPSWGVVNVRIYRTVSSVGASMSTLDAGNVMDTAWMLVGVVGVSAVSFTDSSFADTLSTALEEDVVVPPPDTLKGITWVETQNTLAGYSGNRLYFSRNNEYHNWPYHLDLDDNICGIREVNNTLYVVTDGKPYVVEATSTDKEAGVRSARRLAVSFPAVVCGNRHIAELPQGVAYPSHNGLVVLSHNALPMVLTHPLYAPEDWQRLLPHTVVPVAVGGKLFVFAHGGSFVVNLSTDIEGGWPLDTHSELSDVTVRDAFVTRAGDLMLLKEDEKVYQWNRGSALRPYQWHSPLFRMTKPIAFAAFRTIHAKGFVDAQVVVDHDVAFEETLLRSDHWALPMWAIGHEWQIRLRGTANVSQVALATSMRDF